MRCPSFKRSVLLFLAACAFGCGSDAEVRKQQAPAEVLSNDRLGPGKSWRPGGAAPGSDDKDSGADVALTHQRGYLNQGDVDDALAQSQRKLTSCYERAGTAQRYASGRVVLRFLVSRTGQVSDVLVLKSELGNYAVERCLVVEGRSIPFPRPGGNQDADFEYTLQFRASGEDHVLVWDQNIMAKDLDAQSTTLQSCGPVSAEPVQAVAYVRPGGAVTSVGLSSAGILDTMNAMCVVEQIRKWRLPADGAHVVRSSFPLSVMLSPPPPSAASSAHVGKRARRLSR